MHYTYEKRWAGLGALCLAMSIITLDNTVLDVALPSISSDLKASMSELQWIVNIYILFFASILITIGALGDQFGRKRFLKIGIVLFSLASLGAGVSTSTTELILFRSLSGLGAAFIMPSTLSIITHMFTDSDERMKAIGLWSMIFGLSQGLGPLIGASSLSTLHGTGSFSSTFLLDSLLFFILHGFCPNLTTKVLKQTL